MRHEDLAGEFCRTRSGSISVTGALGAATAISLYLAAFHVVPGSVGLYFGVVASFMTYFLLTRLVVSVPGVVAAIWTLAAIAGRYANSRGGSSDGATVGFRLPAALAERTTNVMLIAAIVVLLSASVVAVFLRPGVQRFRTTRLPPANVAWLLLAAALVPIVLILADVRGALLERTTYLVGESGGLSSLGNQLGIAGVAVLGFLLAGKQPAIRAAAAGAVGCYSVVFFGLGSRRFALIPILIAAGWYIARPTIRTGIGMVIAGAASLYLIKIPLYLRSEPFHGLIPYLQVLPSILARPDRFEVTFTNLTAGFPIIGATAFYQPPIATSSLLVEFNPAPGSLAGWYNINRNFGINAYTPYAGLGELRNHGWLSLVLICVFTGALLGYFQWRTAVVAAAGVSFVGVGFIGLAALFAFGMLQYDLRTTYRILWYAVAIDIVLVIVLHYGFLRRPSQPAPLLRTRSVRGNSVVAD